MPYVFTSLRPLAAFAWVLAVAMPSFAANDAEVRIATFDKAWQLINERYWDPDFGGLDWAGVKEELRPEAEAAKDNEELRAVLRKMLDRLGQSHFGIISGGEAAETEDVDAELSGDAECSSELRDQLLARIRSTDGGGAQHAEPGFDVGFVDGEVYVTRVEKEGAATQVGVEPGWQLLAVDGVKLSAVPSCFGDDLEARTLRSLVHSTATGLLKGPPGDAVEVRFDAPDAEPVDLEIDRRIPTDIETVKFGNLPEVDVRFSADWSEGIVLVRFNMWMMPVAGLFEQLALELGEADGLIIDLRGNPGGVAGLAPGIAGFLLGEKQSLGTLKYRTSSLNLLAQPRRVTRAGESLETFTGPVAILIDSMSASTSEIFAASMQDLERARLFGERTMAAALPAVVEELPNGDYLMHALADLLRPNGGRIEGVGVSPDAEVQVTLDGLRAGQDEVLLAAQRWIAEQVAEVPAGQSKADG